MTTVIDPGGSPVVIFNKSGTAVIDMAVNTGDGQPYVPIPYYASDTIVRVTGTFVSGDTTVGGVMLPEEAEVGDHVQIAFMFGSDGFSYKAPTGQTIDGGSTPNMLGGFVWLRKISDTEWRKR